jgi:hypothetical protein
MNLLSRISERQREDAVSAEDEASGLPEHVPPVAEDAAPAPQEVPSGVERGAELDDLRARVAALEGELARYRDREEQASKTLLVAATHAMRVREDARRDATLALKKARAQADEMLGGLERRRAELEREVERLRQATDETRAVLAGFLSNALETLGPGGDAPVDASLRDALESTLRAHDERPAAPADPGAVAVQEST